MSICHLKRELFLLPLFTRAFQTAKVSSLSTPTPLASLLFTSYRIFPWKHLGNHSFIVKYLHLEPNSIMYFIEKSNKEDLVLWNAVLLASSTPCSTKEGFFPWKHEGQFATLRDIFLLPLFTRASQTAMLSSVSTLTPLASHFWTSLMTFPWKHLGNGSFIVK